MLNRFVSLVVCLGGLSGAALAQSTQGIGYAVQFPASATGQFQLYPENPASFAKANLGNTGPTGPNQIIAKQDGSKFYILGSSGIDSIDPGFQTPKAINGLTGTFTQGMMTPDAKYLLVAATQSGGGGTLYILNTANDTVVLSQSVSGTIVGMAVSRDASTAWILGNNAAAFIITINLGSMSAVGSPIYLRDPTTGATLAGDPQNISLSPLGKLYVTGQNQVLEIDPTIFLSCETSQTCSPFTEIQVEALPGPLQYTPDGAFAYFLNQTPSAGGRSLYRMALTPDHTLLDYISQEIFDSVMVAGQNRIFAHSSTQANGGSDTTLWDVAPDLSSVNVSALQSILPATQVYSAVISGELPTAQYLFVMAGGPTLSDIYMVSLSNNSVTAQAAAALGLGPMQFVYVPSEQPAGFTTPLTYNSSQLNLAAGATAAPLIARFLDQNGAPVFNVPVTITGDPSQTITPKTTTTNADGYVQATVKMGTTAGAFPVTMTAGSGNNTITATFALTIPGGGTGTGTGTGTGGPNQLSIIAGNGQLFQNNYFRSATPYNQLTVQLLDTKGNPLQNYNVTFTVNPTSGAGPGGVSGATSTSVTTDQNGMAATPFSPGYLAENVPFATYTVSAVATDGSGNVLGTQTFTESVYQTNPDGTGVPNFTVTLPGNTTSLTITGGEGDVIPDAIQVTVYATAFGKPEPIPGVGMRISDFTGTAAGPGTCQGGPLSDQTGTITCNFIPACLSTLNSAPGLLHGFNVVVGEAEQFPYFAVNIGTGSTQTLTIGTGNNQNANPGSALTVPLSAVVTDNCGSGIAGIPVTWKVTQGSATLSTTSSVTVAGGTAMTKVTLGSTAGTVKITATINGGTSVIFTETANAIVGTLSLTSGGNQSALEGNAFAQPLVFTLKDNNGNALPGFTVNFSLGGGSASASLSATSASTNAQGQASVTVTAGNAPGTVVVNATFSTFSASATLTVTAPGLGLSASSFVNAASFQPGLVPCGLATVTGAGLAPGISGVFSGNTLGIGPLPYTLQGVSITVGLIPAPILSVSNQGGVQQVNFQTPCEVPAGNNATVVVQVGSGTTTVTGVTVYPTQPGIFTYAGPGGLNYAAVISASNGSYLTPSNLGHVGATYYMVVTGMGQTSPQAVTNSPGTGSQTIAPSQVTLAIDNIGVPVTSVTYLEGAVGEYIITFTIPNVGGNGQPFPTGTNLPISLGGIVGSTGQTIYDTATVDFPGID